MDYVAFAVGVGGIARRRPGIDELLRVWNARLTEQRTGLSLRQGFGHTGNFSVKSEQGRAVGEIADRLHEVLGARFAVFSVPEFRGWLQKLKAEIGEPPQVSPDRRATPGAVMAVNAGSGIPPSPERCQAVVFSVFACPRVRGVWKLDILSADKKTLDRKRREGSWGRIASVMKSSDNSTWTARSLSTLKRLAERLGEADPSRDQESPDLG